MSCWSRIEDNTGEALILLALHELDDLHDLMPYLPCVLEAIFNGKEGGTWSERMRVVTYPAEVCRVQQNILRSAHRECLGETKISAVYLNRGDDASCACRLHSVQPLHSGILIAYHVTAFILGAIPVCAPGGGGGGCLFWQQSSTFTMDTASSRPGVAVSKSSPSW